MRSSFVDYLKREWIGKGRYTAPLIGCSIENIDQIRTAQQVERLPKVYKEFMMAFGVASGGLLHDGEFRFPYVLNFKKKWLNVLPSSDCFVFIDGREMTALFFRTESNEDNPTIFLINEHLDVERGYTITNYSLLTEFLFDWVQEELEAKI